jgi:hypothetical protein
MADITESRLANTKPQLPNEIWDKIVRQIPDHDDREDNLKSVENSMEHNGSPCSRGLEHDNIPTANLQTLRSLCLVSKKMSAITRRHLYTQFIHDSGDEACILRQFLIKIIKEPSLARELKYISWRRGLSWSKACLLSTKEYDAYVQENLQCGDERGPESETCMVERACAMSGLRF